MKTLIAALAACILFAAPASANVTKDENGWICGALEDWEIASLRLDQKVVLNNFFFEEKGSMFTNMTVLEIKFSVINPSASQYHMSSQFVGYGEAGAATFAMSVSPTFQMVSEGTSTSENDIYIAGSVLPGTAKVCMAFAAESM